MGNLDLQSKLHQEEQLSPFCMLNVDPEEHKHLSIEHNKFWLLINLTQLRDLWVVRCFCNRDIYQSDLKENVGVFIAFPTLFEKYNGHELVHIDQQHFSKLLSYLGHLNYQEHPQLSSLLHQRTKPTNYYLIMEY